MTIEFVIADLLAQDVDAVVNPANERLAHGGGVAGLIARAAGPDLEEDSLRIGGCPTGDAVVTRAGRLPQRAVIHAVGPVWRGGGAGEARLLAAAHRAVVARAQEEGLATIALPAISTDPASGRCIPERIFPRVDLPAPFSPTRECISPSSKVNMPS